MTSQIRAADGSIYRVSPDNVTFMETQTHHSENKQLAKNFAEMEMSAAHTIVY